MASLDTLDVESPPRRHRITVDEYLRMGEVGLFAPDARVELIDGEVFDMAPIGDSHNGKVDRLSRIFHRAVGDRAIVRTQGSSRLGNLSMPQPDLALLAPREDFYEHGGSATADILLVAEVSDSTLRFDRDIKMPLYARHGVPEAWIVDVQHGELRIYRSPRDGSYCDETVTSAPGEIRPVKLPDIALDLRALFGT
ncbi:MAG TPA: Uma2 family endonuclease [Steroidobacteraceae bacterium]|nr:Uma2 family endonuclease [Steroidobacteraceae bacterium]